MLQTLAALDLSLTMHGEGIPEARKSDVPIEVVDLRAIVDAHREGHP